MNRWTGWAKAAFEVAGQGKSFRDNPILGHPTLNRYGLHAARVATAELAAQSRWLQLRPLISREHRRSFHRDGFLAIENFLDRGVFEAAAHALCSYRGPGRAMVQGDTVTERVLLDRAALSRLPALRPVVNDARLLRLLAYASSTNIPPLLYVQRIINGSQPGRADPQKLLHADTFHPTMKAWLFVQDVAKDGGAFTYVPGSHRLTPARLRWEYQLSLRAANGDNSYSSRGSARIHPDELASLGLPAAKPLAVRANTLVVANTHGFHARGPAASCCTRLELWAYQRCNPFSPWAWTSQPGRGRLEHAVLRRWWQYQDARAEREGRAPTWRYQPQMSFASAPGQPTTG